MERFKLGIKVVGNFSSAICIKLIRKYIKLPIADIKSKIQNGEMLYECDTLDNNGLDLIIEMYNDMSSNGIICKLYELGYESTIENFYNRKKTYAEISAETEQIIDFESDDE